MRNFKILLKGSYDVAPLPTIIASKLHFKIVPIASLNIALNKQTLNLKLLLHHIVPDVHGNVNNFPASIYANSAPIVGWQRKSP